MRKALNDKDTTNHPKQTTENNTATLLCKMLATKSDERLTEDDNLERIHHTRIIGNLHINQFNNFCKT